MLIQENLKDKDFYKKRRNGLINNFSNLLVSKKHCKKLFDFRISSSYEYKSMKPEDKTKKYRN